VFNIELTYRAVVAGFTVTEVPITFRDRTVGESKMSLSIAIEALRLVPKLRRAQPRITAAGVAAGRSSSSNGSMPGDADAPGAPGEAPSAAGSPPARG
jgi:dolichol-phosphate mannosyltransferase